MNDTIQPFVCLSIAFRLPFVYLSIAVRHFAPASINNPPESISSQARSKTICVLLVAADRLVAIKRLQSSERSNKSAKIQSKSRAWKILSFSSIETCRPLPRASKRQRASARLVFQVSIPQWSLVSSFTQRFACPDCKRVVRFIDRMHSGIASKLQQCESLPSSSNANRFQSQAM